MVLLKRVITVVVGLLVLLTLVGFLLPSEYVVRRSVEIDAPVGRVYEHVVDLKKWPDWGVWFKRDPNMSIEYSGPSKAIGMQSSWKSETQGNGDMVITELVYQQSITYELSFPDMGTRSTGKFTFRAEGESTYVEWSDSGDVGNNPLYRYFTIVIDDMLGPDFESGLDNLKTITENTP